MPGGPSVWIVYNKKATWEEAASFIRSYTKKGGKSKGFIKGLTSYTYIIFISTR